MEFENKIALVTGAGGNIGRHVALHLARGGAVIAVVDCSEEGAAETVRLIEEAGGRAKAYICDVTDQPAVQKTWAAVEAELGAVDILVTVAGGSARSRAALLYDQTPEVITDIITMNLFGALWFAREAAISYRRRTAPGRIIFVASILGIVGSENHVDYSAAKGGLIAASKALAKELGELGVTVNCVSPGLVNRPDEKNDVRATNYLNDFCLADDIADAVEFLASPKARFITGDNLVVDGGRSLAVKRQ